MNKLTNWIVQKILTEIHNGNKHIVAFYPGRFQPFAKQHKYVFEFMQQQFPDSYIITSGKVEPERSPLNFEEKKKVMVMSGIKANKVKQVMLPYIVGRPSKTGEWIYTKGWEDILGKYDAETTSIIFFIGEKDKLRLLPKSDKGKYFKNYADVRVLNGFKENAYYYIVPNLKVDGKVASATKIREVLRSKELSINEKKEFCKETLAKYSDELFNFLMVKFNGTNLITEDKMLLTCGGAFGHMSHVFEDKDLTFTDLKNIIIKSLNGQLSSEIIEKVDGQNLMISWINGELRFARNATQLKNFGEKSLTVDEIKSKFEGRGDLSDAFGFAADDLYDSISSLTDRQREKIFRNGKRWMNLEVLWPSTTNVIPYNMKLIIFHNFREYDKDGNVITGDFHESARILSGMIKQIGKDVQKNFQISTLPMIKLPPSKDFNEKKDTFLDELKTIQNRYGLSDGDRLKKYFTMDWIKLFKQKSKEFNYNMPDNVLEMILNRFVFFDKSINLRKLKEEVQNKEFLLWLLNFMESGESSKLRRSITEPLKNLFLKLSVEVLSNISTFLTPNKDETIKKIKDEIDKIKEEVKQSNDLNKLKKLEIELQKIEMMGGFNKIIPSEGIVFSYTPVGETEPRLYKYTGMFGPVNQILGIIKYSRA